MRKRFLSFLLAALLLTALLPAAGAATTQDLNQPTVFLKQDQSGTCTLSATAMMLRRAAMLRGDADWAEITEAAIRPSVWISGCGLPYSFSYAGFTVDHATLPGGSANTAVLIDLLAAHPEGVMLHARGVPHGVLLTDYTDGVFYCADPAPGYPTDRIPLDTCYGVRASNATAYWYVSSPALTAEAAAPQTEEGGTVQTQTAAAPDAAPVQPDQAVQAVQPKSAAKPEKTEMGALTKLLEKIKGQNTAAAGTMLFGLPLAEHC